jgi:hypothetical protein
MNLDYGAFPPCTMLRMSRHRAKHKWHICSECFAPITIGERYYITVYKDDNNGKIAHYKTHDGCPYMEDW